MSDREIYSYKILQDADLSQNDILNVRNIKNNDYGILVESNKQVKIDSSDENSTSNLQLTPGNVNIETNEGIIKTSDLSIDSESVVNVETPELLNNVSEHYQTVVGDKSINIIQNEELDSFVLQNGASSKIEINEDDITETTSESNFNASESINANTPIVNISASDKLNIDTPSTLIKDDDTTLVVLEKTQGQINIPGDGGELSVKVNDNIEVQSQAFIYEGGTVNFEVKDGIDTNTSETYVGDFTVSAKDSSVEGLNNKLRVNSSDGVSIGASKTKISSNNIEGLNYYSPNGIEVLNNDVNIYTANPGAESGDDVRSLINLHQEYDEQEEKYFHTIFIKSQDVKLDSDKSASLKSGNNYFEVDSSKGGKVYIEDGNLSLESNRGPVEINSDNYIESKVGEDVSIKQSNTGYILAQVTNDSSLRINNDSVNIDSNKVNIYSDTETNIGSDSKVNIEVGISKSEYSSNNISHSVNDNSIVLSSDGKIESSSNVENLIEVNNGLLISKIITSASSIREISSNISAEAGDNSIVVDASDGVSITGPFGITGDINVTGELSVSDKASFDKGVEINSEGLSVIGDTTLSNNLEVTGGSNFSGDVTLNNLTANGSVSILSTLGASVGSSYLGISENKAQIKSGNNEMSVTPTSGSINVPGGDLSVSSNSLIKTEVGSSSLKVKTDEILLEGNKTSIESESADILSDTISVGNSDSSSSLSIEAANNLRVLTDGSRVDNIYSSGESVMVSDNYLFNKSLRSNNIEIYWDIENNSLVFGAR